MLDEKRIIEIFENTGVLQEGHFVLSSGLHANRYLQCAQVLQYPKYANELAAGIAELWVDEDIDTVIGPAIGGIVVSYAVGQALGVKAIFSERKDDEMKLRRGFEVRSGEKILLVEDVVTTGGSVKEVIKLLEKTEVEIIGISSLVERSGGTADFNYEFKPLFSLNIESFKPEDCKLCKQDIPFTKPGSRKNI